jgi:hypothetical protein
VALVKKAAGGFGAASLMGRPQMCLGHGRTPRRVIYAPVSERETACFIPDSPSCRRRGQNYDGLLCFFVKRLLNIGRKLDSKNRVSIPPWQTRMGIRIRRLDKAFPRKSHCSSAGC